MQKPIAHTIKLGVVHQQLANIASKLILTFKIIKKKYNINFSKKILGSYILLKNCSGQRWLSNYMPHTCTISLQDLHLEKNIRPFIIKTKPRVILDWDTL